MRGDFFYGVYTIDCYSLIARFRIAFSWIYYKNLLYSLSILALFK